MTPMDHTSHLRRRQPVTDLSQFARYRGETLQLTRRTASRRRDVVASNVNIWRL